MARRYIYIYIYIYKELLNTVKEFVNKLNNIFSNFFIGLGFNKIIIATNIKIFKTILEKA